MVLVYFQSIMKPNLLVEDGSGCVGFREDRVVAMQQKACDSSSKAVVCGDEQVNVVRIETAFGESRLQNILQRVHAR